MQTGLDTSIKPAHKRRPIAPLIALNQPGRLRFANLMALLGMSHQTIYSRMKKGTIPQPDGYDGPCPFWFTATILPLLERAEQTSVNQANPSLLG